MTPRFKLALAGLVALMLGCAVAWVFTDRRDPRSDDAVDPLSAGNNTRGGLLEGIDVPTQPGATGTVPGGADTTRLVGARDPQGPDYSDPVFRTKKLGELLAAVPIPWRDVRRLLAIMDQPLSEHAKTTLVHALRSGPRGLVLQALSAVHDGTITEDLLALVDDPGATQAVRQAALLALGRMPGAEDDAVAKALASRLSGSFREDVNLLAAMAERGGGEAARAVIAYLTRAGDESIRPEAFDRFDFASDEAARAVFLKALSEEQSPVVTQQLLTLAGKPGAAALVPAIEKLDDEDAPLALRRQVLKTLGRIGTGDAIRHVLERAREGGEMGTAALRSLDAVRSADPAAREALRNEFARAGVAARPTESKTRILRALGRLRDKESLPVMVRALDDPDQQVERAAIHAMGGLGKHAHTVVPRLVEVYTAANGQTQAAVVHALGTMGGADALRHLKEWSAAEDLDANLTRMLRTAVLSVQHRLESQSK